MLNKQDLPDIKEPEVIDPPPKEEFNIAVVSSDKHLDQLVQEMPEPVTDAINAAKSKEDEIKAIQGAARDKKGRPFNPEIHQADTSGHPIFTPTGQFKKKVRTPQSTSGMSPDARLPENTPDIKIKMAAAKLADVFIITGISFFGDEWKPENTKDYNERGMLIDANERWMIEHGYIEPPAWIDLALAYGLYAGKRVFQPTTKSRVKVMWESTKRFFTNVWLRITGQKIKIVPTGSE